WDSGGRVYGGCASAPTTVSSPSKPFVRAACAARIPASDAPTTTSRMGRFSALDPDCHHRADLDCFLHLCPARLVDVLGPAQHVVVAELEHVGRDRHALAVALTQVHVDQDLHRCLLSALLLDHAL